MSRARESTIQKKAQERRRKADLYSDAARGYLRDHNIPFVINAALERIILEQPDDPLLMLQEELQSYNAQGVRVSASPARSPQSPSRGAPMQDVPNNEDHEILDVVQEDLFNGEKQTTSEVVQVDTYDATPASEVKVSEDPTDAVTTSESVEPTVEQQPAQPFSAAEADIVKEFVSDIIRRVAKNLNQQQVDDETDAPTASRAVSPSTTAVSEAVLDIEEDDDSAAQS